MTAANHRHRLALAADGSLRDSLALYVQVREWFGVVKVGLELFTAEGPAAVRAFQDAGAEVFLDLKLHDIPNTVERAAASAARLGAAYLTIHAGGGEAMVAAAVNGAREARGTARPKILAVTVLTSLDEAGLKALNVGVPLGSHVEHLAALAQRGGADGVVCSVGEVAAVKAARGRTFVTCTPGIRLSGTAPNDQKRVETPDAAVRAGSDLLVVGRAVSAAANPSAAAAEVASLVASAAAA